MQKMSLMILSCRHNFIGIWRKNHGKLQGIIQKNDCGMTRNDILRHERLRMTTQEVTFHRTKCCYLHRHSLPFMPFSVYARRWQRHNSLIQKEVYDWLILEIHSPICGKTIFRARGAVKKVSYSRDFRSMVILSY